MSRAGGKRLRLALFVAAAAGAALWLGNQSVWVDPPSAGAWLLAHRGVHQTFPLDGVGNDTCTATRIVPPLHDYIENTLPSMAAAIAAGAEVVEFDVQPTADGDVAVFHDWTLECRTDGQGVTREATLAQLKALDVGHGYSADGGRSFPLRGRGVGLMPSLDEVLRRFPQQRFLVHVKSRDPAEGALLARKLAHLPAAQLARLVVYGSAEPLDALQAALPAARVASRRSLMQCLTRYAALGWSGHVPQACRNSLMLVPSNLAPWLWGWPHRLVRRLRAAGSDVVVLGPYTGGDFSRGIDDAEALARLPADYAGGIWTNRIERIGPLLRRPGAAAGSSSAP
ncbi:glycerophosphodiester phosphodiesterase [Schlegelella sp. S2-27]|uniref:Glycerophosphodiester phosphodiesterase n=1 Tax=Caldimonas mangrovi TaxID=2944811 RepID=A0ABT0YQ10_9BURK|nr:glycerophosphodiester phosphodiesterase family protein [Caldimonas mangrovi]MCM5680825.1 glycerophosphodiester phosphodiesterase [Caldimonas mangrovi]